MATERANDPRAFRDFLDANLGGGDENLTLYEYLDLWDFENSPNEAKEETLRRHSAGTCGRGRRAVQAARRV